LDEPLPARGLGRRERQMALVYEGDSDSSHIIPDPDQPLISFEEPADTEDEPLVDLGHEQTGSGLQSGVGLRKRERPITATQADRDPRRVRFLGVPSSSESPLPEVPLSPLRREATSFEENREMAIRELAGLYVPRQDKKITASAVY